MIHISNQSVSPKNYPFLHKWIRSKKTVVSNPIGAISSFQFLFAYDMGLAFHERAFTFGRFNGQSRRVFSNGACNETHTFRHARVQLVAITSLKLYRVFWNIYPNRIMDMILCMIGIKIKVNTTCAEIFKIWKYAIWHSTFCLFLNIMKHFIGRHNKHRRNLLFSNFCTTVRWGFIRKGSAVKWYFDITGGIYFSSCKFCIL